jgi:hypothetical protein
MVAESFREYYNNPQNLRSKDEDWYQAMKVFIDQSGN